MIYFVDSVPKLAYAFAVYAQYVLIALICYTMLLKIIPDIDYAMSEPARHEDFYHDPLP